MLAARPSLTQSESDATALDALATLEAALVTLAGVARHRAAGSDPGLDLDFGGGIRLDLDHR